MKAKAVPHKKVQKTRKKRALPVNAKPIHSGKMQKSFARSALGNFNQTQAEQNYKMLFDNMLVAVVYTQLVIKSGKAVDFIHLAVNGAYERITGFKNVAGKKISELIPGFWKHDSLLLDALSRVSATGKSECIEIFIPLRKSWHNVSISRTKKNFLLTIFDDITKSKELELRLKASEERFRGLFESSPEGVTVSDASDRTIMANKAFYTLLGENMPREGEHFNLKFAATRYFVKEERKRIFEDRARALVTGDATPAIYTIKQRGGALKKVEVVRYVLKDGKGDNTGLVAVFRDVTEKFDKEERIRKSEARYRMLSENILDVVWVFDKHLRCSYVSPSYRSSRGIAPESVIGKSLKEFVDKRSYEETKKVTSELYAYALAKDPRARIARIVENRLKTASGEYIFGEAKINVLWDESGEPIGFVGVTRDVTEKKRLEARLMQSQKLEAVVQLAAGVSHEFNNLLTIMQLSAEQALLLNTKEAYERLAGEVLASTNKAVNITRALNEFAKKPKTEKRELDIAECLDKAIDLTGIKYSRHGIQIVKDYEKPPKTLTDEKLLLQVFINLLNNAHQAMPSKGTLSVKVWRSEGNIFVSIRDTGAGIKKENLDKIFTPFYTTKGAFGSGEHAGTGLGLSVSYSIIRDLGGEISVESIEGKGSKFTISIPVIAASAPVLETPILKNPTAAKTGKILVVDDQKPILSIMKTMLETAGYTVETAESGKAALLVLEQFHANVLLLDLVIPGTNIEILLGDLTALFPEIRVIVMTGLGEAGMRNWQAILDKYCVCGVVQKPYEFSKLKQEIDKCLGPRSC